MPLQTNTLYYGDNLQILRDYIPDESIDLIYLDPPFNSQRSYNVLFKETTAAASEAQMEAFDDTWHWNGPTIAAYEQVALHGSDHTAKLLKAMVDALGNNDVTAYLSMMAIRLIELRRVLKKTGSIYLHCDPTASHYLKVLMDSIFGPKFFRNEITWERSQPKSHAFTRFASSHDVILAYGREQESTWNAQYGDYDPEYVKSHYGSIEPATGRHFQLDNVMNPNPDRPNLTYEWHGHTRVWRWTKDRMERLDREGRLVYTKSGLPRYKRYLDEMPGTPIGDMWTDIPPINSQAQERLGYPTQKPLALLQRIIEASSNPGDIVLDPFCGCGTAVHAAQKLDRQWVGIDITHLAIGVIRRRMEDAFPVLKGKINVVGEPMDLTGAAELAASNPYQFQWWALGRLGAATPQSDRKKGMDRGIDGIIPFLEGASNRKRVIVSVKAGKLTPAYVRDLKGVLEREGEPIGVLFTLNPPTREMKTEAAAAGTYHSERWGKSYPKLQIITAADIFNGKTVAMPPQFSSFAAAPVERKREGKQSGLDL